MNNKKKINIIIISLTIFIVFVEYFFHPFFYLIQEYGNLDSDLKHILITFVMAGLGGSLFAFRNKVKGELFDQFEAMELLLLIVIPSVEGYSFIMINPTNYSWAISLYVVAVMVWFVIVITKHKPISDSKKEKIFTIKISYISAVLLAYGIFAFWLLNTYNQMLTHTP